MKGSDDKRDASHVTAMCERGSKRSLPGSLSFKDMSCFSPLLPICALDGSHQCGGGGVSREAMPTIENPLKQSFSHLLGLMTGLNCAEQQCSVLPTGEDVSVRVFQVTRLGCTKFPFGKFWVCNI